MKDLPEKMTEKDETEPGGGSPPKIGRVNNAGSESNMNVYNLGEKKKCFLKTGNFIACKL